MKKNQILISSLVLLFLLSACKNENNYEDDVELCNLLSKMTDDDQKIRNMDLLQNGTQKQKDSLWEIQNEIDLRNTKLLIEITENRGWVSKKKLSCDGTMAPVVIFRHSPKQYFEKIKELIETESKAGRMEGGDYMFIDNHLQGRPAFDFQIVE